MATFIIVPGAFTPPAMFQDFCDYAKAQGITAITVQLPTVGRRPKQPAPSIADDVQAICQIAEPLLDEDKEVILVTSSLGGVQGTQCLEFLCTKERVARGKMGGIEKVVYVSSLILEPDTSALDFFGAEPPPIMRFKEGDEYSAWMDEVDDGTLTFSDLPRDQALFHKSKMERYHSRENFENKLTFPGYKFAKIYYVVCEEDRIIPKEVQLMLIETLKKYAEGGVTVKTISAGHLPFVTRIEDTLKIFQEIAKT